MLSFKPNKIRSFKNNFVFFVKKLRKSLVIKYKYLYLYQQRNKQKQNIMKNLEKNTVTTLKQDYITHLLNLRNDFYIKGQFNLVDKINEELRKLNIS